MADAAHIQRTPGEATISIYQGDTLSLTFDVTSAGSDIAAAFFNIKTRRGVSLHALTVGSGITLNDADTITVELTEVQTAALSPDTHFYDLQFQLDNGNKLTWVYGVFDVLKQQ